MTSWYVTAHSKDECAPVSWTWEQMGFTCKSNLVVYSPTTLRQLFSRTMIENGTLYLQLCPRRVGCPFLSSTPLKSGNPLFSWDRLTHLPTSSQLPAWSGGCPTIQCCLCLSGIQSTTRSHREDIQWIQGGGVCSIYLWSMPCPIVSLKNSTSISTSLSSPCA